MKLANATNRRRRWLQFRLRTLLIGTTILAAASGLLARRIERQRRQQETADAIVGLGGAVKYDYEAHSGLRSATPAWLLRLLGENLYDEVTDVDFGATRRPLAASADPIDFHYLTRVETLDLSRANLSDVGLAHLAGLTQLRQLNLRWNRATDEGMQALSGLGQLEELDLTWNRIGDRGVVELGRLSRLKKLNLSDNPLGDAGLVSLSGLVALEELDLEGTHVTDAGLASLKPLTRLTALNLSRTTVTDVGVTELQRSIPDCTIAR